VAWQKKKERKKKEGSELSSYRKLSIDFEYYITLHQQELLAPTSIPIRRNEHVNAQKRDRTSSHGAKSASAVGQRTVQKQGRRVKYEFFHCLN
jgi:hypothetical protein